MNGAFYVPTVVEAARVEELGAGQQAHDGHYLSGLLRVEGEVREDAFLFGSNRLACYYTMPGQLTVERFEQWGDHSADTQQSRLILQLTEGILTVDSSALPEGSQLIVETPLGKLCAGAGQWSVYVTYDVRTRIYNFTLESLDVELSFKTHPGDRFVVQAGQMLTGAGASTLPDLEIRDLLNSAQDRFDGLNRFIEETAAAVSVDQLRAKMSPIENRISASRFDTTEAGMDGLLGTGRPIVIEYSPRPQPLVPFRGEMRPLREYQKDLF